MLIAGLIIIAVSAVVVHLALKAFTDRRTIDGVRLSRAQFKDLTHANLKSRRYDKYGR